MANNNKSNTDRTGHGPDILESLCREVGLVGHAEQGETTDFVRIPGLDLVGSSEAQGSPRSKHDSGGQPPALSPMQAQRRLRHGGQETAAAAGPSRDAGQGLQRRIRRPQEEEEEEEEESEESRSSDGSSCGSDDSQDVGESTPEIVTLDDSDEEAAIWAGYVRAAERASILEPNRPAPLDVDMEEPFDVGSDDEGGLGKQPEASSGREDGANPGGHGLQILFKELVGAYSAQSPHLGLGEIYNLAGRHLTRLGFMLPESLNVATDHELGD